MLLPRANTLFHFTKGGMPALKSILKNGFFPHYSVEDLSWESEWRDLHIAFPLVSFCDIPISRISDHLRFYGYYGLGMNKDWGLAKKLNPVLYLWHGSPLSKFIKTAFKGANTLKKEHDEPEHLDSMRNICAYIKTLEGDAPTIEGEKEKKLFYFENEWRFVPTTRGIKPYLKKEEYSNEHEQEQFNESVRKASLKFHPNDIRYIFVKEEWDVDELIDFIYNELEEYPLHRRKQLLTRITAIEDLQTDI